jgi:hypothetical protein
MPNMFVVQYNPQSPQVGEFYRVTEWDGTKFIAEVMAVNDESITLKYINDGLVLTMSLLHFFVDIATDSQQLLPVLTC